MTVDEILDELTPPPGVPSQLQYDIVVEDPNGNDLGVDQVRWDHSDRKVVIETS